MENTSKIRPLGYRVLIKPDKIENKIGSIYIPDIAIEERKKEQIKGVIVAMGNRAFDRVSFKPKIGDSVYFSKYDGQDEVGKDGEDYRIINDDGITALYGDTPIPLWFNVLVKIKEKQDRTAGGIFLDDNVSERNMLKDRYGTVIAKSEDAFCDFNESVDIGDYVSFIQYSGFVINHNDQSYRVLKDEEINGIHINN